MPDTGTPDAADQPAAGLMSSIGLPEDHLAWENATRQRCDRLLQEAEELAEAGKPLDALHRLDAAVAELLTVPQGYKIRQVYLNYLSQLLAETETLQSTLEVEVPGPADELVELPAVEIAEGEAPEQAPREATGEATGEATDEATTAAASAGALTTGPVLPASDLPLVLNPTVERFLDAFTRTGEYRNRVGLGLKRAGAYLPMIREHLGAAQLPLDLAYLPLIESAFSTSAYSRARAVGMWQFISGTARANGLSVGPLLDERRDPVLSTRAAAAHLSDLYQELGDWYLALAAYNSGSGNVRRAIRRAGSHDFWELRRYLPRETRNYVPAFIAAIIVAKSPERYGFTASQDVPWRLDRIEVPDALDLQVLARRLELPIDELRTLNPAIRRDVTPARTRTTLWLPPDRGAEAEAALAALPTSDWAPRLVHTVRRGESLSTIARQLGSSVAGIRAANNLRGSLIRPGQTLIVPRLGIDGGSRGSSASSRQASHGIYQVRQADTLWDIATAFGVSVEQLCTANGLTTSSVIQPGQGLRVPGLGAARLSTSGHAAGRSTDGDSDIYRVRGGDTLYGIARRFGITVAALREANRLNGSRIYPGDVLRIPS